MEFKDQIIVKRWKPILEEYEKTKAKISPRSFKFVNDLCRAHHISTKELRRYHRKWLEGNKQDESFLPKKRGARPGSRRIPKEIERNIVKAYRRFGSNRYELVLLFKPYYLDKTPSPATMDRIKARYPLNESQKKIIKRYEKQAPGELAHIDLTKLPKDIQVILDELRAECVQWAGAPQDEEENTGKDMFKKAGGEMYTWPPAERDKWVALTKPTYDGWVKEMEGKGLPGKKVYEAYLSVLNKLGIKLPF